ncbi:MAG: DUF370 domain-containing protein [Bacillota bacterium]|nr:DUF370 domain-containing protein [Bacillota bacterium]
MSRENFIRIGHGNLANLSRCVAIVHADSAPARRMIQDARDRLLVVDASSGRKTRTVLVMDSEHLLLSSLSAEEIARQLPDVPPASAAAEGGD